MLRRPDADDDQIERIEAGQMLGTVEGVGRAIMVGGRPRALHARRADSGKFEIRQRRQRRQVGCRRPAASHARANQSYSDSAGHAAPLPRQTLRRS